MIWVDFNSANGRYLTAREEHADEPLEVGAELTARDADGNQARVTVSAIDDGAVLLRFHRATFQGAL